MMIIYPRYYTDFHCSASACTDTCCRNWEIDIDEASLQKYLSLDGDFGQRLRENIISEDSAGQAKFRLKSNGRCPFLNEKNLCDIYIELGKASLCQICTDHPRYYYFCGDVTLAGVGLCCEEAAKLIFSADDCLECHDFFTADFPAELQPFWEQLQRLLAHAEELTAEWLTSKALDDADLFRELIDLLLSLEINSSRWKEMLCSLREYLPSVFAERKNFLQKNPAALNQYERLTRYFLFRHFMKASEYEEPREGVASELQLVMISIWMIFCLNILHWLQAGVFTLADQVDICKLYSQEIEYDEDNTTALENFLL